MKIHFLGTGAAEGIPAIFCNCAYCRAARQEKIVRSRSQIVFDGELSVDFPPDAFYHMASSGEDFSALKYVLITHSHMDHFYANDFVLRGYKYAHGLTEPELNLFGSEEVCDMFCESTRRELREDIRSTIHLYVLGAFEEVRFGGWKAYPLKAKHSSKEPLVFLLEKEGKRVLHLHDTGLLPDEDYEYLAMVGGNAADLIIFDCTFLYDRAAENARHMGLWENREVLKRLEAIGFADGHTKKVITHFSHNAAPTAEKLKRAEEEFGVIAAYDGMRLEI